MAKEDIRHVRVDSERKAVTEVFLNNAPLEKIQRLDARRILTSETQAALDEDTRKDRRYQSSEELLKALKG